MDKRRKKFSPRSNSIPSHQLTQHKQPRHITHSCEYSTSATVNLAEEYWIESLGLECYYTVSRPGSTGFGLHHAHRTLAHQYRFDGGAQWTCLLMAERPAKRYQEGDRWPCRRRPGVPFVDSGGISILWTLCVDLGAVVCSAVVQVQHPISLCRILAPCMD